MKSTGHYVETSRGRSIYQWTNDDGTVPEKPFTSEPIGSFDRTAHATLEEARAHVATAPALRKVRVTLEAYLPPGVTANEDQIDAWVKFELHSGSLPIANPLMISPFEAISCDIEVINVQ